MKQWNNCTYVTTMPENDPASYFPSIGKAVEMALGKENISTQDVMRALSDGLIINTNIPWEFWHHVD